MTKEQVPASAAAWALSKVGCAYSQAKRTQETIFDCSSLVARAYTAQGKQWRYGGRVPISMYEVYDDDFELLWPADYSQIGKAMGGTAQINLATQAGAIQFLCTDSKTTRRNRITHVAMVADSKKIVHARGKNYGVCTNKIDLYSGKLCALTRYNPECSLREGMCGWRTLSLQQLLNKNGADLSEDGEFGNSTRSAVCTYQKANGLNVSGIADQDTRRALGILSGDSAAETAEDKADWLMVTGDTVNLRSGPGTDYPVVVVLRKGEPLKPIATEGWECVEFNSDLCWISSKYVGTR